jgi:hypothetical protein
LSGSNDADSFDCGPGRDTITDFDAGEGDTKTGDCENFLSNESVLIDNATIGTLPSSSNETIGNFPITEEDASSGPPTTTTTTTVTSSSNETEAATATAEIMPALPDEEEEEEEEEQQQNQNSAISTTPTRPTYEEDIFN